MTRRDIHLGQSDLPRKSSMRRTALHLKAGDVIETDGRYRGIVQSIRHHGMCATVELFDGANINLGPGESICVRV